MKNPGCTLALAATLALGSSPAGHAQHPPVVVNDNSGLGGLEWRTAAEILYPDGSVRSSVVGSTRWQLKEQFAWFNERFGGSQEAAALVDGFLPSSASIVRRHCKPWPVIDYPSPEHYGSDLTSILLLSDVAVVGTIAEVVPGFEGAHPRLLHALSDVTPLRRGSFVPEYLLMPVAQYVINGRVFCSDPQFNRWLPALETGERIVLIGRWSQGVVWTGPALTYDLATLDEETGDLKWRNGHLGYGPKDRPATLALLQERIDEAVHGGLFEMAAPLLLEGSGSQKRRELTEALWNLNQEGCRITAAEERGDGTWELTQTCGSVEQRVVR